MSDFSNRTQEKNMPQTNNNKIPLNYRSNPIHLSHELHIETREIESQIQ